MTVASRSIVEGINVVILGEMAHMSAASGGFAGRYECSGSRGRRSSSLAVSIGRRFDSRKLAIQCAILERAEILKTLIDYTRHFAPASRLRRLRRARAELANAYEWSADTASRPTPTKSTNANEAAARHAIARNPILRSTPSGATGSRSRAAARVGPSSKKPAKSVVTRPPIPKVRSRSTAAAKSRYD
jgi:hypothetical protein